MDYPPKDDAEKIEKGKDNFSCNLNKDSLIVDFSKYDQDGFISSKDFKDKFSILLKNNDLFYEFNNRLENLLNKSIDEEGIIEECIYSHKLGAQNEEIKKIINEKIDPYINEIIFNYENGLFQEKIKIISFLSSIYFSSLFLNNFTTREKISKFFNQILESEKDDSGNYYIFSHLKALFENNEGSSLFTKISPDQYTMNRFVYDNKQGYREGKDQTFISKKEDFEEISKLIILVEGQKKKKDELYKKVEDFFNKSEDKNEKEIDFDYNSKEPVVLEYLELGNDLDKNEKLLNSYFTDELTESYFRPNIKKENYQNKFFDHKFFQYKSIRDNFKERSGFSLEETTIPEQYNYFEFTKEITNKDADKFFNFLKVYGRNALRTFLSIEQGGKEMGNKILTLGEKLPENVAQKLFEKYREIIDITDKAEEEVRKIYEKDNIPNEVFNSIKETLLKRGAELLSLIADNLKDKNINEVDVLSQLEFIKTDTMIMGESYVEMYKSGVKIPIENIVGTTTERKNVRDLTDEQKKEILDVYIKGRPENTYDNKEHVLLLKKEFEAILNNEMTYLFNVIFNNKVIAFATFNKENEDTLHVGGLTFIDDVRNSPFAVAVMNSMIKSFNDYNIEALVDSKNPIMKMYLKRFGFEIVKELPREENAGELYYKIMKKKISSKYTKVDSEKLAV